jgi:hypothetical protein
MAMAPGTPLEQQRRALHPSDRAGHPTRATTPGQGVTAGRGMRSEQDDGAAARVGWDGQPPECDAAVDGEG